eukprot:COSAG06_NODE_56930_length_282_cov_1.120219_1_plen_40_part_01
MAVSNGNQGHLKNRNAVVGRLGLSGTTDANFAWAFAAASF